MKGKKIAGSLVKKMHPKNQNIVCIEGYLVCNKSEALFFFINDWYSPGNGLTSLWNNCITDILQKLTMKIPLLR